jgi:hypothetical protein
VIRIEDTNICGGIKTERERREEHKLRMFENRVLRRIFGLKMAEIIRGWKNRTVRSFITYILLQIQLE